MDRKTRRRNKLIREFKAMQILGDEEKFGNRNASIILMRIEKVKNLMNELKDLPLFDHDIISKEFFAELEKENRMLINMTLQYGWPKTYLKNLFAKQKQERILNQNNHGKSKKIKKGNPD